jgi:hypothetical protein
VPMGAFMVERGIVDGNRLAITEKRRATPHCAL